MKNLTKLPNKKTVTINRYQRSKVKGHPSIDPTNTTALTSTHLIGI